MPASIEETMENIEALLSRLTLAVEAALELADGQFQYGEHKGGWSRLREFRVPDR